MELANVLKHAFDGASVHPNLRAGHINHPVLGNSVARIQIPHDALIHGEGAVTYFDREEHVLSLGVGTAVTTTSAFQEQQVRLWLGMASEIQRMTGSELRSAVEPKYEVLVQNVQDVGVPAADGRHGDDVPLDQLDAILWRKYAGGGHLVVLLDADTPSGRGGRSIHAPISAALTPTVNPVRSGLLCDGAQLPSVSG